MSITETPMAPTMAHEASASPNAPQDSAAVVAAELEEYRSMVTAVAQSADGRVIVNRSEAHAAVVIEYVIRSAVTELSILTGNLHRPVYANPGVVDSLRTFFEKNAAANIRLLSEAPIDADHPLLAVLSQHASRVDMRVIQPDTARKILFHFIVADGRSFRFEADKTKFEALAQFGEPQIGSELKAVFDKLFARVSVKVQA